MASGAFVLGLVLTVVTVATSDMSLSSAEISEHNVSSILTGNAMKLFQEAASVITSQIPEKLATVKTSNTLCRDHSVMYLTNITTEYWAMKMFDATAKIPAGVLEGNIRWLGNYDECVNVEVPAFSSLPAFSGKYCLATLSLASPTGGNPINIENLNPELKAMLDELLAIKGNGQGMLSQIIGFQIGFCVPSSCQSTDLQTPLDMMVRPYNLKATVAPIACSTTETPSFEAKDWGMLSVLIVFGVLIVLGTANDLWVLYRKRGRRYRLLVAFSVYSNGKSLLSTNSSAETMGCINGIRFLSMAWVIFAHKFMGEVSTPRMNFIPMLELRRDWRKMVVLNAFVSVDTFFLLSGVLLVYVFLKQVEKTRRFNGPDLLMFYLYRYIRLTPALAIVVGINSTLFYHLGTGPMWPAWAANIRNNCAISWWKTLIYLNNYNYMEAISGGECVGQSWYLQTDMQLYWLSPLFLIPLWKWPTFGLGILGALIAVCIVVPFWLTLDLALPWAPTVTHPKILEYMRYVYKPPYYRGGAYFIGAMLGFYLYRTRNRKIHMPKWLVLLGWVVSAVTCLAVLYGLVVVYTKGYVYDAVEAAFYSSLHRLAWAVGVGWVVFACVKGYGGPVNAFLSWRFFQPLSRLTYCAYLCHVIIINYMVGISRTAEFYTDQRTAEKYLGDLVIALLVAFIFSLTFESPILVIEKALFKKGGSNRQQKKDEPEPADAVNDKIKPLFNGHKNEAFLDDEKTKSPEVIVMKPLDNDAGR